uniref:Uncharacterized protein n=1 Tax=Ditylenchus dipsaci TaxID=166011 RepID=A0A915DNR6_9BILA
MWFLTTSLPLLFLLDVVAASKKDKETAAHKTWMKVYLIGFSFCCALTFISLISFVLIAVLWVETEDGNKKKRAKELQLLILSDEFRSKPHIHLVYSTQ